MATLKYWDGAAWQLLTGGGPTVYSQPDTPPTGPVGDIWIDTDDTIQPGPLGPTFVTSLPPTPVDGQEVYYQADSANGINWHLRYNAGSSSPYKWEFLGGPSVVQTAVAVTASGGANVWAVVPTPLRYTTPLAGDWEVENYAFLAKAAGQGAYTIFIGVGVSGAAPPAGRSTWILFPSASEGMQFPTALGMTILGVAAGATLDQMSAESAASAAYTVGGRTLVARPVRVG